MGTSVVRPGVGGRWARPSTLLTRAIAQLSSSPLNLLPVARISLLCPLRWGTPLCPLPLSRETGQGVSWQYCCGSMSRAVSCPELAAFCW